MAQITIVLSVTAPNRPTLFGRDVSPTAYAMHAVDTALLSLREGVTASITHATRTDPSPEGDSTED